MVDAVIALVYLEIIRQNPVLTGGQKTGETEIHSSAFGGHTGRLDCLSHNSRSNVEFDIRQRPLHADV